MRLGGLKRAVSAMDRMLLREFAVLFAGTIAGVVLLYLVIDFADRAGSYGGPAWGRAVAELYLNKAAVVAYQLAPAALILASALLIAQLSRRGELVALFGLGVRPARLAAPVSVFAAAVGALLFLFNERVVVRADQRVDEISLRRFSTWGDWGNYLIGTSWVRGRGGRIFHLGPRGEDGAFTPATVLEIIPPFRLARRIDARRLESVGPGRWRMLDAVETVYPAPTGQEALRIEEKRTPLLLEEFPDTPEELSLRSGRPRQMRWNTLRHEADRRERLGQPTREFRVALAERAAQPLQAIPAALAAVGVTLWRGRAGRRRSRSLSAAFAVAIALTVALWAVSVIAHGAAVSGSLPAAVAALAPSAACLVCAGFTFARTH
jgi:lipopolysaccharide export system permease protein